MFELWIPLTIGAAFFPSIFIISIYAQNPDDGDINLIKSKNDLWNVAFNERDSINLFTLFEPGSIMISEGGKFVLIIPFKEEDHLIALASDVNLFPNNILRIKGNPESEVKRSLLEFSFRKSAVKPEELIIETERHKYTRDYINLTKDFYLKM